MVSAFAYQRCRFWMEAVCADAVQGPRVAVCVCVIVCGCERRIRLSEVVFSLPGWYAPAGW